MLFSKKIISIDSGPAVVLPNRNFLVFNDTRIEFASPEPPRRVAGGFIFPSGQVRLHHHYGNTLFLKQGWQSWSYSDWVHVADDPAQKADPAKRLEAENEFAFELDKMNSQGMTMLQSPDGNCLLLGSLGTSGTFQADGTMVESVIDTAGKPVFVAYGPEDKVVNAYSKQLKAALYPRGFRPQRVQSLWCSWYSYYDGISQNALLQDLKDLKDYDIEVFQVDDGWQDKVGDWGVNDKFPAGMKAMAQSIKEAGRRPGLWMAPFVAARDSALFKRHPDWFVRDESGAPRPMLKNWGGYCALDVTHPEVKRYVKATIRKAVQDWGFSFLKLDFLFAAAVRGQRFDNTISREDAFRESIELLREAAGKETYLMGCGTPLIPSVGVFDGMRIGSDTAPFWAFPERQVFRNDKCSPSGINGVRNSFHRLWMNSLFQADTDVAFFRSKKSILSREHKGAIQAIAQVAGLKGTSDPVRWLKPREQEEMKDWYATTDRVQKLDRYRYKLNGRVLDFEVILKGPQTHWSRGK